MNKPKLVVILLLGVWLQAYWLSGFSAGAGTPNLVILILVAAYYLHRVERTLIVGLAALAGFYLDSLAANWFGLRTLLLGLIAFGLSTVRAPARRTSRTLLTRQVVLLATIYELGFWLVYLIRVHSSFDIAASLTASAISILLTGVLAALFGKRLQLIMGSS